MRVLAPLLVLAATTFAQDYGTSHRLKIPITGETRKGVLFIPRALKKNEVLPLLVAIPDTRGKAFLEVGQWQQPAYDQRFAVFSVDVTTSLAEGWHPSDQLVMQRDMEAVTEGIKTAVETARAEGVELDLTATVMTGHSGGTYLTLWLGLRRPDLFLAICGRSCVFFKETVQRTKYDKVDPDFNLRIFIYHGEVDAKRAKDNTRLAKKTLDEAGYKRVTHRVIPDMRHESKPEIFLEWYQSLLKETAKGRKESLKVAAEVATLREMEAKKKPGVYGKLVKLLEREKKAGFGHSAATFYAEVEAAAKKLWEQAVNLEADNDPIGAASILKEIEKQYKGIPAAKQAREARVKLLRSDAYKSTELLLKAKELIAKGKREKAIPILEKIVKNYPETVAAEEAAGLLRG